MITFVCQASADVILRESNPQRRKYADGPIQKYFGNDAINDRALFLATIFSHQKIACIALIYQSMHS